MKTYRFTCASCARENLVLDNDATALPNFCCFCGQSQLPQIRCARCSELTTDTGTALCHFCEDELIELMERA
jgi:hypothetical protein